jgi:hypothetical protein
MHIHNQIHKHKKYCWVLKGRVVCIKVFKCALIEG